MLNNSENIIIEKPHTFFSKRILLIAIYCFVGVIAGLVLFFILSPERLVSFKTPSITLNQCAFRGWGGNRDSAGIYNLSGSVSVAHMQEYCVLILTRGPGDAPWTLQVEIDPKTKQKRPKCALIVGNNKYWEAQVYIGDRLTLPNQKLFSIVALVAKQENVQAVNWISYSPPAGVPEFSARSQIDKLFPNAIWSEPVDVSLP